MLSIVRRYIKSIYVAPMVNTSLLLIVNYILLIALAITNHMVVDEKTTIIIVVFMLCVLISYGILLYVKNTHSKFSSIAGVMLDIITISLSSMMMILIIANLK